MALNEQQTKEINLRIDRFLHLLKEGESSPGGMGVYSPSPGLEIIGMKGETYSPPKDEAYRQAIIKSLENLLELAHATSGFKDYIKKQFITTYNLGADFSYATNTVQSLIDPYNNLNNSFFNSEFSHAEKLERLHLFTCDKIRDFDSTNGDIADRWKEELEIKYKK